MNDEKNESVIEMPAAVSASGPAKSFSPEKPARKRWGCLRWGVIVVLVAILSFFFGLLGSLAGAVVFSKVSGHLPFLRHSDGVSTVVREQVVDQDSIVVDLVERASPAVVSIVASKDVPKFRNVGPFGGFPFFFFDPFQEQDPQGDRGNGETEKQKVGSGTGFFVSSDGLVVTNKHVVSDDGADYTVFTSDGKEHKATVLARDPVQDMAVMKVDGAGFPTLTLGDSDTIKAGQTVIAIGNSLGEFSNSVSRGIISGLGRDVTAGSGFGEEETLTNIIQTDAAINPGNSGGPLLDISGRVIGINVAVARGAENIGFAIPINSVKRAVEDVEKTGKISIPYIGVRYAIIDEEAQKDNNLPFDYGAIVLRGTKPTEFAVIPGSPADKAGIVENDIILEIDGTKIDADHPLGTIIAGYRPGDTVTLKVWHKGDTKDVKVILEERK